MRADSPGPIVILALFVAAVAVAVAVGAVGEDADSEPFGDTPGVLSSLDLTTEGHRRALAYAEASDDLAGLYAAAHDAVVRIWVERPSETPGRVATSHGSGVIVEQGRYVATAAHVLENVGEHEDAKVLVILRDGRIRKGIPLTWEYERDKGVKTDWGLIPIDGAPETSSLEIDSIAPGERALILGYPASTGVNHEGRVQKDGIRRPLGLDPVATVVELSSVDEEEATAIAGATPLGGTSGGPLVARGGRVVGIFHAMTAHRNGERSWTTCDYDPMDAIEQYLERERQR